MFSKSWIEVARDVGNEGSFMTVPYFVPSIAEEEIAAVSACLRSGWLTTGENVKEFEDAFRSAVSSQYALALNSCTAALHLAVEALGLRPRQKVLVPTMTFAATAEVIIQLGGVPVLVDCDSQSLSIDLADAARKLRAARAGVGGGAVVGIVVMHYGGVMIDMDAVSEFAREHSLWVVEDAAHAFPSAYLSRGRGGLVKCGEDTSDVTCFSFYANKTITTGEGGMAVTSSKQIYERMKAMSLHGLSRDAWNRYGGGSWDYQITDAGFKYNMTDIAAAIGIQQIHKAEQFREAREAIAQRYIQELRGTCLQLPACGSGDIASWHLFPVRLPLSKSHVRDKLIRELAVAGIGTSVHWRPLHDHLFYKAGSIGATADCPIASREWQRLISLPIYPGMTTEQVGSVITAIHETLSELRL